MPVSRCGGVYEPADLELLQRVFDRLCQERRLAKKDREQREQLAKEVFRVFDKGITSEANLWRAITKRRRGFTGT
ncbi:RNA-binding protein [Mesorhizobium sp. WSM3876]|uniref:RNA-binding protein n=1 Tax=Mesorhizobium sp. WSM3876 TaxID=422277 RepID=UPI001596A1CE|nr:RNA-binding protein [Mesorhizobium sp. WSM3876]